MPSIQEADHHRGDVATIQTDIGVINNITNIGLQIDQRHRYMYIHRQYRDGHNSINGRLTTIEVTSRPYRPTSAIANIPTSMPESIKARLRQDIHRCIGHNSK